MTAKDCGWHSGPWKPSVHYTETDPRQMLVFFDGGYTKKNEPGGFPFAFTLGCLEIEGSKVPSEGQGKKKKGTETGDLLRISAPCPLELFCKPSV